MQRLAGKLLGLLTFRMPPSADAVASGIIVRIHAAAVLHVCDHHFDDRRLTRYTELQMGDVLAATQPDRPARDTFAGMVLLVCRTRSGFCNS
jgi:hypothetical protein